MGFWSSPTPATDRIEEAYPLVDRDAYPAQLAHRARCQAFPIWNAVRSEIGQMDMYVRIYDDLKRDEGDNPTVGILLCAAKDQSVVRYSVLHESEQMFASRYKLVLPSEEELRAELARDAEVIRQALHLEQPEADDGENG